MKTGDNGTSGHSTATYEAALDALSSLITKRRRCDKTGDRFDLLFDYIKMLDLEEPISKLKVIHVAGTKGKGSTCTFTESILRNCGFHTGLFTSPHLIDVRERFRLDGMDINKEKFLVYFWWCYNKLKENTNKDLPMPTLFRFLALLAFKIFSDEKVDVAILEVGLGGKFDATNVVQAPVVCGISSLGYDHMEILGNTLGEIAGEKAGIFKQGVPAFTVCQPDEAMKALQTKANKLNVHLQVVPPLDVNLLKGLKLGLEGEHQYINAGLAVALCSTWLQRTGNSEITNLENNSLPEQFLHGLTTTSFEGRAQIVADRYTEIESPGGLVFFLDGAHSPESMEACAKWFSHAIKANEQREILNHQPGNHYRSSNGLEQEIPAEKVRRTPCSSLNVSMATLLQILLFNCMSVRDPQLLLPRLIKTCADEGVHFKKALFTPNVSFHNKVGTHALTQANAQTDLSWQFKVQRMWENLMQTDKGGDYKSPDVIIHARKDQSEMGSRNCENSTVFSSLSSAIKWLRTSVRQNRSVRLQVLVTGSLHLVGDVLRLVK